MGVGRESTFDRLRSGLTDPRALLHRRNLEHPKAPAETEAKSIFNTN